MSFWFSVFDRGSWQSGCKVLWDASRSGEQQCHVDEFINASWCCQDDRHPEKVWGAAGKLATHLNLKRLWSPDIPYIVIENKCVILVQTQTWSNYLLWFKKFWCMIVIPVTLIQGVTFRVERGEMVIARILHGSSIDRQGMLHTGDIICEVNGQEVGTSPQELQELLKACSGSILLKVLPSYRETPALPQVRKQSCFLCNFLPEGNHHWLAYVYNIKYLWGVLVNWGCWEVALYLSGI